MQLSESSQNNTHQCNNMHFISQVIRHLSWHVKLFPHPMSEISYQWQSSTKISVASPVGLCMTQSCSTKSAMLACKIHTVSEIFRTKQQARDKLALPLFWMFHCATNGQAGLSCTMWPSSAQGLHNCHRAMMSSVWNFSVECQISPWAQ